MSVGQLCESCPLVNVCLFECFFVVVVVCLFIFCYSFSISNINFQSPSNPFLKSSKALIN